MKFSFESSSISILVASFSFLSVISALAQTVDPNAVDGHIHLKISSDPGIILDGYTGGNIGLDLLFTASGLDSIYKPFPLAGTSLDSIYRVVFPNAAQVNSLITALEALPYVSFAEKNPIAFEFFTPNDLQPNQWSLEKIQAEYAWNYTTGSSSVLVAVVDNAIAIGHSDLAANIYTNAAEVNGLAFLDDDLNGRADDVNGYDVVDNDPDPIPANASNSGGYTHGTHVAGIAGAATNNGIGMASIGYGIKILPVKIADDATNTLSGALDGVFYAMRSGADVISMSWGVLNDVAALRTMIAQANSDGIVLVAAAGNDGDQTLHYPAAYPQVISVGATDQNDQKASFSNYGSTIDVMAPGVDIYSTLPQGNNTYGTYNGTSMATPMVSGLAALVLSYFPSFSPAQVRSRIVQGCEDISAQNPNFSGQLGAGRINAFRTLGTVGITEANTEGITIYPNPANDIVHVHNDGNRTVQRISVIDGTGRVVIESNMKNTVDVSELSAGVYFLLAEIEDKMVQTKLLVQ